LGLRDLAIIDDVVTTGSTVEELARVLKRAGALHVQVWALARTP
jgi:predicted amidophosphoribosyltransferase